MIRRANINDVDVITEIEIRVFRHPWNKKQILQELKQENGKVVYVEIEEVIIGYIMIQTVKNESQILNIAIDLPFQHRGFGKKLLQHVNSITLMAKTP